MRRFWLKNVLGRVKLGIRHIVSFSLLPACQKARAASCKLQAAKRSISLSCMGLGRAVRTRD